LVQKFYKKKLFLQFTIAFRLRIVWNFKRPFRNTRTCSTYGVEERGIQGFSGGNLRERDHLEDPGVDGRIILKWIFERVDGMHRLDRSGLGQGQMADSCESGDEPSGSITCGEFLE
jgi:hypothetical protein